MTFVIAFLLNALVPYADSLIVWDTKYTGSIFSFLAAAMIALAFPSNTLLFLFCNNSSSFFANADSFTL